MKWHRIVINGLVGALVVDMWNLGEIEEIIAVVMLCAILTILGLRDDENN